MENIKEILTSILNQANEHLELSFELSRERDTLKYDGNEIQELAEKYYTEDVDHVFEISEKAYYILKILVENFDKFSFTELSRDSDAESFKYKYLVDNMFILNHSGDVMYSSESREEYEYDIFEINNIDSGLFEILYADKESCIAIRQKYIDEVRESLTAKVKFDHLSNSRHTVYYRIIINSKYGVEGDSIESDCYCPSLVSKEDYQERFEQRAKYEIAQINSSLDKLQDKKTPSIGFLSDEDEEKCQKISNLDILDYVNKKIQD